MYVYRLRLAWFLISIVLWDDSYKLGVYKTSNTSTLR